LIIQYMQSLTMNLLKAPWGYLIVGLSNQ